jgi:ribosomal protein S18 acetylase RimI-like enzyme
MTFINGLNVIVRYNELNRIHLAEVENLFFINSNKDFSSDKKRLEFKNKWLDSYINNPDLFFVKIINEKIAGYINGAESTLSDISDFDLLTRSYPSHLHINVSTAYQSKGIGKELISYFKRHLANRGVLGVHIVTSPEARNVGFYRQNGFTDTETSSCQKYLFMGAKTS